MDNQRPDNMFKILCAFAAFWCAGVLLQGFFNAHGYSLAYVDFTLSGAFGDSFGGLSAFMATAAAIGAWRAVGYQRDELTSAQSREAQLDKLAAKRDFEATFFHLQRTLDRITSQIDLGYLTWKKTGKDAFSALVSQVYKAKDKQDPNYQNAYSTIFLKNQDDLAHYFRILYNIIAFADRSDRDDSYFYVKLVRSTLSEPELVLLALNGVYHEEGLANFKPLIEKYALLNNISFGAKADFDLNDLYHAKAFGGRGIEIMTVGTS